MTAQESRTPRTWLITGAGRGLGKAFSKAALAGGDRVVGTVRRPGALDDLVAEYPETVREILLDVRDATAVSTAVASAAQIFGGLDVVVNNAGAGFVGALEEVEEHQVRDLFDLNLFGAMWVSRAAIPHLRAREGQPRGGDIVQISTVGAVGSMPTFGLYNASKAALEGFSDALSMELAQFGINVTIAQLGGFATDWAGSSMTFASPLPQYDELRRSVFGTAEVPWPSPDPESPLSDADSPGADHSDAEPTDAAPSVAADALVSHLAGSDRPLRVLIGDDARGHVGLAYAARRDSYGAPGAVDWPS